MIDPKRIIGTPAIMYELDLIPDFNQTHRDFRYGEVCQAYGCDDTPTWYLTTRFEKAVILRTELCHGHAQLVDQFLKAQLTTTTK